MTLKPWLIALMLVAAACSGASVATAQDDPPGAPASFYGDVAGANGVDAPEGTTIVAVVDGEVEATITVTEAGQYGGSDADDDKLRVDSNAGDEVAFHVGDAGGPQAGTHSLESGVYEVNLEFPAGTFEEDDDNETQPDDSETQPDDDETQSNDDETQSGDRDGAEEPEAPQEPEPEVPENVEVVNNETADIEVDEETGQSMATFSENSSVERITFETSDTGGAVTVVETESEPDETGSAPGASVSVTQITVPEGSEDQSATIRNRVPAERFEAIEADAEDLRVNRYNENAGEWQGLETEVVEQSGNRVVLEAETPGFSYFAVSAVSEPQAALAINPETSEPGEEITLSAAKSSDRYSEIVAYEWSVAGQQLDGETAAVTVEDAGTYDVELTVTNDAGETDTTSETFAVRAEQEDAQPPATEDPGEEPAQITLEQRIIGAVAVIAIFLLGIMLVRRKHR